MRILLAVCIIFAAEVIAANAKTITLKDIREPVYEVDTNILQNSGKIPDIELIPALTTCNGERCEASCRRNGYDFGVCVSSTRCHCFNLVDSKTVDRTQY